MTETASEPLAATPGTALPTGLLIGSEWVHATSAGTMDHVDPTTGRVQASFPIAGPDEVDAAVAAARAGLEAYRSWPPDQRRDVMRRIADGARAAADDFTAISIRECGMIRTAAEAMGPRLADWFDYYAGWADKLDGHVVPGASGFSYTRPEPVGVVAVLLTWNGPTASIGMKVAAALAAGCSVVLKPPELAPFGSNLFGRICLEAGLPPGVLDIVPGGPEAGAALVGHPGIDKISFTGGGPTAAAIQRQCAESLTPLILELGGKSANLLFADADLERAIDASFAGIIRLSGQFCVAPSRLFVEASVHDEVVDGLSRRFGAVVIGDPADRATEMGPLISTTARDRIVGMIDAGRDRGEGTVVAGGTAVEPPGCGGGFVAPTLFTGVDNGSGIARNEFFGPVLAVASFTDEDEAVRLANDTEYGLAAYLHTRDVGRAHRVAARLDAGSVAVNGARAVNGPHAPFGGFKASGYGKEGGYDGIYEYLRIKNVTIAL